MFMYKEMTLKLNIYERMISYCYFIAFFFAIYAPATMGSTLGTENFRIIVRGLFFLLGGIVAIFCGYYGKLKLSISKLIICLWPFVYLIYVRTWTYNGAIIGGTSFAILASLFAIQNDNICTKVFILSKYLMIVISIVGIVCFVMYFVGIGKGFSKVHYYAAYDNMYYINYKISFLVKNPLYTRLCGLFNEPGWMGTFLAFYLCADDLNLKKKTNWLFTIAGILTFSLAFVFIIAIYYLGRYVKTYKQKTIFVVVALLYFFVLPQAHTGIRSVDYILSRMVFSEGRLIGDNRTTAQFDAVFKSFLQSENLLFGMGGGYSDRIKGVLSIKDNILDYGVMGVCFLYVPLFGAIWHRIRLNYRAKLYLICIMVSMYQRPMIYELSNFVIMLAGISYIVNFNKELGKTNEMSNKES
ncbi:hypothetical protein [Butyrivibrio sp. VCD2006]|uniref:hypothetical protein n=1 Tax=Butyrivibrio sp. VCD2006 TaxID=1280664 RepID=UPI0003F4F6C4|nr:hypothetical protein [Butyrivibrio sp. VCD2006]